MKILLSALLLMFVAAACDNNTKDTSKTGSDTTGFTPPKIVPDTMNTSSNLSLSPTELQDDSVFSDGSIPTSWQNAGITDVNRFKLFLKQLQEMVMNNDKEKLASAIQYPLKEIKSEKELLQNYDKVFTREVKLSFATINFSQLFRNQNGVMTDGGKVWIRQVGKDFKIVAIN